jgi:uncharacterized protein (TIGR03437 family)
MSQGGTVGQRTIILFLLCGTTWAQSFTFRPGVVYPAGSGSITAAQGDFNADGKLDIAVGNAASSNISIYLGNSDGSFTAGTSIAVPGCVIGFLAAGDFHRDGHPDLLAVCLFQTTIYVVPGSGGGKFGTPISTNLPNDTFFGFADGNFQNVAVADFNNDGAPDLAIGLIDGSTSKLDTSTLSINVMLSKGDGTFQAPTTLVSGNTLVATAILVGDFDRDGNPDIAVAGATPAGNTSQVQVFLGTGQGAFTAPTNFALPVLTALGSATIADVNRDGLPDLIFAGSPDTTSHSLCVFTGTGGGNFKQAFLVSEAANLTTIGMIAADLRGTGTLDLVEMVGDLTNAANSPFTFSLQARGGNGDGTFGNPTALAFPAGLGPWPYGMLAGNWTSSGLVGLAFAALPSSVNFSGQGGTGIQAALNGYQALPGGDLVVLLNGSTPAPALAVSQKQLQFAYVAGGPTPPRQSVAISNSGSGPLNWTATADSSWLAVSPASGQAPASLSIAVLPGTMSPATYTGNVQVTAAGAAASPQTISVTLTISAGGSAPVITGVINGASFQPGFESGSWVTIQGSNLSSTNPGRTWTASEIVNGALPTSLDQTSVKIDGKAAYVYYISPTQLNVQAPDDSTTGAVSVVVTNNGQQSAPFSAQLSTDSPAFFLYPGTSYAIASHFPDYALVGNPSTISGTVAAHPGDLLILWATGFGPTSPTTPAGAVVTGAPAVATKPSVTVNGIEVFYSAVLSPGNAGLYQIAIQLPASMPTGVAAVQASVGGVTSPTGINLYIQ